jgi:serine/threonine protein kinase
MTPNDETNKEGMDSWRDEVTLSAEDSLGAGSGTFLSIGSLVEGKYRLVEGLGEGGMGVVYKVEQVLLNRQMALKTLTGSEFSESSIKRFHAEAKLLAKLDHPGLVKVRDFGFIDNVKPFLVMDFVQGRTLSSVLKTSGVMPLDVAIKIFVELCFALGYAHSKNIVHRDIKPSNIMLTTPGLDSENEHVKVLDFGIAKLLHRGLNETEQLTRTGEIFGSPFYMSPEQCLGRPVDHRSDIYSMGCVMFEVLTGAPPFAGETSISTIMMHQSEKPLTLKEASMGREYPPEIENLVASMLEKDPDNRIQSLLDVAQLLIGVQKGLSGGTILNKSVNVPKQQDNSRGDGGLSTQNKIVVFVLSALLVGALGLVGFLYNNQRPTPKPIENAPDLPNGKWSHISPDGKMRVFNFPEDFSIGSIGFEGRQKYRIKAQGNVEVPASEKLLFKPNSMFLAHPQFLKNFSSDDIDFIDFKDGGLTDSANAKYKITARAPLTDDELIYCNHLKTLSGLGLKNCTITDTGLSYIKDLPLTQLNVDGTDVTAKGLSGMSCFKKLNYLRACHLRDGGQILRALKGSKSIHDLSLTGSDVGDEDLKVLQTLPNLESLNIGYNVRITDRGLPYLEKLKNLKAISVDQTSMTPRAAIDCFKKLNLTYRPKFTTLGWSSELKDELEKTWPQQEP